MDLTPKQNKFCEYIVSGLSGKDSYLKAYNCKSEKAACIESTKLLKRDDITARITELRKPIVNLAQNTAINERQQQIDFIKSRIQECIKKDDEQSLIRWNEQLNKIYALYKETETTEKQESTVNNLDAATLRKLSGIA
jgi:phage terminase small subunit